MSEPIVFISHWKVKEGKLDGVTQLFGEVSQQLEAEKPGTVVFLAYLSEDGTRATFVHVFPDADSMDRHVEGSEERSKKAYEFVEPRGFEIYGTPSEEVMAMMGQASTPEAPLTVEPGRLGGFIRPAQG